MPLAVVALIVLLTGVFVSISLVNRVPLQEELEQAIRKSDPKFSSLLHSVINEQNIVAFYLIDKP